MKRAVFGAVVGAWILALGFLGGWNERHHLSWGEGLAKPLWPYKPKPRPAQFCIVKGAVVTCRPAPPQWRH
jgi:hypothetical protein